METFLIDYIQRGQWDTTEYGGFCMGRIYPFGAQAHRAEGPQ